MHNHSLRKLDSSGFSLLEVLVALVIVTVIVAACISSINFLERQSVINGLRVQSSNYLSNLTALSFVDPSIAEGSIPCSIQLANGQTADCTLNIQSAQQDNLTQVSGEVLWNYGGIEGKTTSSVYSE